MKRLLLCATEAGGARNLVPLIEVARRRECQPTLVTSREMAFMFDACGAEVLHVSGSVPSSADDLIRTIAPEAIVCGTTRYASPERDLIATGRKLGIRTVVALDEWYNYRMRFEDETGGLAYLPDYIAAMDTLARREAVEEGVPYRAIRVTGSPHLAVLMDSIERFAARPPGMPEFLGSASDPVVTFLSETHAADYGASPGGRGPLGPYLGYTEESVRDEVLAVLKRAGRTCVFVEKLHPSSSDEDMDVQYSSGIRWVKIRRADLHSLLWHSAAVIGMRSMALLEAAMLGRPAVSYQPGLTGRDYCTAVRLGLVAGLRGSAELETWYESVMARGCTARERRTERFPFARKDAPERVLQLALGPQHGGHGTVR